MERLAVSFIGALLLALSLLSSATASPAVARETWNSCVKERDRQSGVSPYARDHGWYRNDEPISFRGARYLKTDSDPFVHPMTVHRVATYKGVPVFIDVTKLDSESSPKIIYVPVGPHQRCKVQSYRRTESRRAEPAETLRLVDDDQMEITAASAEIVQVESVLFTPRAIEVMLAFENRHARPYGGTLHPPGAEYAFHLADGNGNRYRLLRQEGWPGQDAGGFGNYTIPPNSSLHLRLSFEPAADPRRVRLLHLVEGSCRGRCWTVSGIRLEDL